MTKIDTYLGVGLGMREVESDLANQKADILRQGIIVLASLYQLESQLPHSSARAQIEIMCLQYGGRI